MSYDHTLVKNPELLHKLSEVLDLLLKKQPGSKVQDAYSFDRTLFKKSTTLGKRSVSLINDCLLNHRFDEAAKLLWILCQDRSCFDLVLYKGIMVVLENHLLSNEIQAVKRISSGIRKLKLVNKLEVQLEYLIYALKNDINGMEDSFYLEDKNAKKKPFKIIPYIQQLYSAYTALIGYIKWANISQSEQSSQEEKDIAFNIIKSFKDLVDSPGIWDIFVLKLIEMLEYYEQYDEIEEVLKKYVEHNPEHINAYIYLCVHLHKHNADPKSFIHYAKILADLCPSDERVLLLIQKWNEQGKYLKRCLRILFMFLDYPINGSRILGWQLLSSNLQKACISKKPSSMKVVKSSWKLRCSSWNYIHFKPSNICIEPVELISYKMKVLSVVEPDHEYMAYVQEKFPNISNEYSVQNVVSLPTSEDLRSLYHIEDDVRSR